MPELDSATIRSLILGAKLTSLHIGTIADTVIDAAVKRKFLERRPQLNAEVALKDRICEVVWSLILEGIYTPGTGFQNPNLPWLRATEYGKKCFDSGDVLPHDPDGYLTQLKSKCSSIDATTVLYLGEALQTFRAGNHLATAVMIGVAAEQTLLNLVSALANALDTPAKQKKFREVTEGKRAKKQHDELMTRLRAASPQLPKTVSANLEQHLGGIYDLIRQTRNESGHPTGRKLERHETNALLLLFPTYCGTAYELIGWLQSNKL